MQRPAGHCSNKNTHYKRRIVSATRPSPTILRAYDGNKIETVCVADVTLQAGDKACTCTCFVVPVEQPVLFDQDVINQLHLLTWTDISMVKVEPIDIYVNSETRPVALPPRRPAFINQERHRGRVKATSGDEHHRTRARGYTMGVPLGTVPVRKANGTLKMCVDYRLLNKSIIRERHVLPTIEEITAKLEGAKVFSVLDAESGLGFHQLPLSRESRSLTTLSSHYGLSGLKDCHFVLPAHLKYSSA